MALRFNVLVRELRLHLCQTGKESAGLREFIQKNYVPTKQAYPNIPILIRECQGVQPAVYVRFDCGVEKSASLTNASSDAVKEIIQRITC